jgi:tRNA-dihydrouridine synthase B
VQMLTVHGRTREQGYKGQAEYDTIAAVKAAVRVPVVANGDITSPEKAREVLAATGADADHDRPRRPGPALDLSRDRPLSGHGRTPGAAAGGRGAPRCCWTTCTTTTACTASITGVRSARKHIAWYVRALPGGEDFRNTSIR